MLNQVFKIDKSKGFEQQLSDVRQQAITTYRLAVADHAAGRKVDLPALQAAAQQFGIEPGRLATVFAADVQVLLQEAEQQAAVELSEKIAREATKAAETARKKIEAAYETYQQLCREAEGEHWSWMAVAEAQRPLKVLREANPRLFATLADADAVELIEQKSATPETVAVGVGADD